MLVYDEAAAPLRRGPSRRESDRRADASRWSLGTVLAVLRRRALLIAACAALGAACAFLAGKALTPRYAAEAQLYIDPRDLRLVDKELTQNGQDASAFLTIVESQAQVITSANVLNRVVQALDLVHDPEFITIELGLAGRIKAALGLGEPPLRDAKSDAERALDALERRIAIRRTGRTFIVDVGAWSNDADKAASIANAVVAAYLAEESATRAEAAERASSGLSARLVELRDAVGKAEDKVQAYKAENGLVGTRDVLVSDQQLTQLNAQLAGARVRTADAQARVDQLQRVLASGSDVGANEDALASQTVSAMRAQFAELSRKQAELMHDLGPRHPQVSSISSQLAQVRRMIDQEIGRYVQSAKTDLARAQATVASLEKSFEAAKTKTVGNAQASIRLRELDREVEASRAVYQAFLLRAQETSQQARLDVGNARVITPAIKPGSPTYPPPARVLALLGLLGGLFVGTGLALADELLRRSIPAPAPLPEPVVAEPIADTAQRELAPIQQPVAATEPICLRPPPPPPVRLPALAVLPEPIAVVRRRSGPKSFGQPVSGAAL